jgi:RNA polymerase sigma-70 factor (ECF subfamily)
MWDEDAGKYLSFCIDVLTLRGGKIAAVTAFIDRDVFPRFGLPDEYPA